MGDSVTGDMDGKSTTEAATPSGEISVARRVLTYITSKFANQDLDRWRNRLTLILFVISVLKLGLFVPIVMSLMMAFGILLFEPNFIAAGFFAATAVWYIVLGLAIPITFRIQELVFESSHGNGR